MSLCRKIIIAASLTAVIEIGAVYAISQLAFIRSFQGILALIPLAALVAFVFYFPVCRIVLRRIRRIGGFVNDIKTSGDLSRRLYPQGSDELAVLGRNIDSMVGALQSSAEALRAKQEMEARLRTTIESVADGIVVIDMEKKIVQVNDAAVRLHGYSSKDELIGRNVLDLIVKEEHEAVIETMKKAIELDHVGHIENNLIKRDGSTSPVEVSAAVLRNSEGKMSGYVASLRDLSERKMAESDLRTLMDSFASGAFLIDPQTHRIIDANHAAVKMFGVDKGELLGHVCHRFVCPAEVGKCPVTDLGQTVNISERKLLDASGREISILKSVNPVTWRGRQYLFETFIDITERKKAESVLAQQKELIDRILAATPNAVMVIGRESKVVLANKTFYQTFKTDEVKGKPLAAVIPVAELTELIANIQSGNASDVTCEFRHNIDNHERIFVANVLKMWQDEILLILNDITEERSRQEKFFLTERLVSVGEMAAGVAHELNNPLTSVIGLSQLLVEEESDPAEMKEDLQAIFSEARRAGAIVKNLLTFARKHTPERELIRVDNILEDVLNLRAYEHKVNNIGVETIFDREVPQVVADYYQIQQVFLNIVLNAEQAMIEAHGRGKLTVTAQRADGMLRIAFADDGPGILPENLKHMFDPFFTTKEVGKGTGLGLSICYGIVSAHGGKIYADSEYGHGATFIVELPIENN